MFHVLCAITVVALYYRILCTNWQKLMCESCALGTYTQTNEIVFSFFRFFYYRHAKIRSQRTNSVGRNGEAIENISRRRSTAIFHFFIAEISVRWSYDFKVNDAETCARCVDQTECLLKQNSVWFDLCSCKMWKARQNLIFFPNLVKLHTRYSYVLIDWLDQTLD